MEILPVDVLFAIIEEIGMQERPDFDLLWAFVRLAVLFALKLKNSYSILSVLNSPERYQDHLAPLLAYSGSTWNLFSQGTHTWLGP
jgi:hypothetical protein